MEAIVVQLLIAYYVNVSLVVTAVPEVAQFFQYFLQMIVWKIFFLKFWVFLSPNLGTNDHFTMVKDSICWCFGRLSYLNKVKSPFSVSNHSKPCSREIQFYATSHQCSALNFEKKLILFEKQGPRMNQKQNNYFHWQ